MKRSELGRRRPQLHQITRMLLAAVLLRHSTSFRPAAVPVVLVATRRVYPWSLFSSSSSYSSSSTEETVRKVPAKFVAVPFDYHQELTINVENLTNRGWGIGRVELSPEDPKWVVMVPNVIPGELVRVRIFRNFPSYSEADLIEILQPSPDRVEPTCNHASICGGCQFQHIRIDSQRLWKTSFVRESFEQFGLQPVILDTFGTDRTYGYRSKITPHYQISRKSQDRPKIGFQQKSSRAPIDVDECAIATPEINTKYQEIRSTLDLSHRKKGATLLFRQANKDEELVSTKHSDYLTTRVRGLDFTYQAGNFFQNNYYILDDLVDYVVSKAAGPKYLVDCYCGSGLFAISAASDFEQVMGIEINDKAIAEAQHNAEANNITNAQFIANSAEHIFDAIDFERSETVTILDPPRKGCSNEFLEQLIQFAPTNVVYVSCDPTTQARDAQVLAQHYSIESVLPFDLFPQTRHIESVMVLRLKTGNSS